MLATDVIMDVDLIFLIFKSIPKSNTI